MTVKHIFNFSIFKDHLLSNSGSVDYKVFVLLVILQGTYVIQILLSLCRDFSSCKFDLIHPHLNLISCNTLLQMEFY